MTITGFLRRRLAVTVALAVLAVLLIVGLVLSLTSAVNLSKPEQLQPRTPFASTANVAWGVPGDFHLELSCNYWELRQVLCNKHHNA